MIRKLIRETNISINNIIYPLFVVEGKNIKHEVKSMPGIYRLSIDNVLKELEKIQDLGIPGVILFGTPDNKDEMASGAYNNKGIVQKTIKIAKKNFPEIILIADTCLCAYTTHGHCGIIKNCKIENDISVDILVKSALSFADAGADIIAPSDMMDGRVLKIRNALDEKGFLDTIIMSYSIKYSSSFYSPFREALDSAPVFGDRKTYQMDICNKYEALKEAELDINEGADIIMVKPALAYLDIINFLKDHFCVPIAAYNVSGEYSMVKAAAKSGYIDEKSAIFEILTAIKRAGADIIITYFAIQFASMIKNNEYSWD